jgi:UDP-N-acetyl-D-mannosaminuronic acid dehydrogenase
VNDRQPHFVVEKVKQVLGPLAGKKIAALGLAYKPDVDDLRESPAVEVVHLLQKEGAQVRAWEPFKPDAKLKDVDMAESFDDAVREADLILLLVRHTEFVKLTPQAMERKTTARLLVDCVNGWQSALWQQAGFSVYRLGVNNSKIANPQS